MIKHTKTTVIDEITSKDWAKITNEYNVHENLRGALFIQFHHTSSGKVLITNTLEEKLTIKWINKDEILTLTVCEEKFIY